MYWSMYTGYRIGYELNKPYLEGKVGKGDGLRLILAAFEGLMVDAVAPWYTVLRRTNGYDEVKKDRPAEEKLMWDEVLHSMIHRIRRL